MEDKIISRAIISSDVISEKTLQEIIEFLDKNKAEDIVSINLQDKSSIADYMIIVTGTSQRHVKSLAEKAEEFLEQLGFCDISLEGEDNCDWVLLDGNGIIIHFFRKEIREFYNLEALWNSDFENTTRVKSN